jgi:hypothetical protein
MYLASNSTLSARKAEAAVHATVAVGASLATKTTTITG